METYLTQLLEDLLARHGDFPPQPNIKALSPTPDFPEVMIDSMTYLYGPTYTMEELFEVKAEAFPPAESLDDEQITHLTDAILALWESLNLTADYPEEVTKRDLYPQLVRLWDGDPVPVVRSSSVHLEFCDYDPENCPWKREHCTCGAL